MLRLYSYDPFLEQNYVTFANLNNTRMYSIVIYIIICLLLLYCYVINSVSTVDSCTATAIKEVCYERDTCNISDVQ